MLNHYLFADLIADNTANNRTINVCITKAAWLTFPQALPPVSSAPANASTPAPDQMASYFLMTFLQSFL